MQTILICFAAHCLTRELAGRDAHQLRDIGLVRAADGSLRLAEDPSQLAVPVRPHRRWNLSALLRQFRVSRSAV